MGFPLSLLFPPWGVWSTEYCVVISIPTRKDRRADNECYARRPPHSGHSQIILVILPVVIAGSIVPAPGRATAIVRLVNSERSLLETARSFGRLMLGLGWHRSLHELSPPPRQRHELCLSKGHGRCNVDSEAVGAPSSRVDADLPV